MAALHVPGGRLTVHDEADTVRHIAANRASIARFGDGELMLMLGYGIYFQEYDRELAARLLEIVQNPRPDFLVCLPRFDGMIINNPVWKKRWARYRRLYSYLARRGCNYHSAALPRPATVGNREPAAFYRTLAELWASRDVVVVHHKAATAEHAMFRGVRSMHHLACRAEHAFRDYASLLAEACALHTTPDVLFLIAAGPTAGVLAWDLNQRGAQALDVGHLTSAYDEHVREFPRAALQFEEQVRGTGSLRTETSQGIGK